ncbi:MAG: holo-[acyl-carrier-protein] synthase [Spirochaetaceae bacterium]|nr:MAG: holo-[acyl-carrier-protein] synthase [Spirochaetaceae bacterium]
MIAGIGVDVVRIGRISSWLGRSTLLERFFHRDEIAALRSRGIGAAESLAARFAAKEAFGKALGSGMRDMRLDEICVTNDERGKPGIVLYGAAREAFVRIRGGRIHLSLTHEGETAIAFVVIEVADE